MVKRMAKSSSAMIMIDTYCGVMHHSKSIIFKINQIINGYVKKIKFKIKLGLKNCFPAAGNGS